MVTQKCVTVTVVEAPKAAFDIVDLTTDKTKYEVGDSPVVTIKIKNIGDASGRVDFEVGFNLLGCYINMSSDFVDSIDPGETKVINRYWTPLTTNDVGTQSISVRLI